jgi:hypothetical protein
VFANTANSTQCKSHGCLSTLMANVFIVIRRLSEERVAENLLTL